MGELSPEEIDNLLSGELGVEESSESSDDTSSEIAEEDTQSDGALPNDLLQELETMAKSPINYSAQTSTAASQQTTAPTSMQQPKAHKPHHRISFSPINARNLQMLLEVPMQVVVEIGRTTKLVKEILALGEGSIIEFDKLATDPVDILVNNKVIGKGEVVVIDENFGVRITEIVSPHRRI